MRRGAVLATASALALAVAPARAAAVPGSVCAFGGPTPGWSATSFRVRPGTEVQLRLTASPPVGIGSPGSSRFVQAAGLLERGSGRLVAAVAGSWGATGRGVVVRSGTDVRVEQAAPVVPRPPVERHHRAAVPPLRGGEYVFVAFGVDGSPAAPNPAWGVELWSSVPVPCRVPAVGDLVDAALDDFGAGRGVSAGSAHLVDGATWRWKSRHPVVFQVLQATAQVTGGARLRAVLPGGRVEEVVDGVRPVATRAGMQRVSASATGVAAEVLVAGVSLRLR